jgi:vacuolar protein sorting-associated protein 11
MCARAHAVIRDIRRNNERLADQHDVFLAEVKENGFKAIASGFGRGVLNTPADPIAA